MVPKISPQPTASLLTCPTMFLAFSNVSSSHLTLASVRRALARHSSCLCPSDKFRPPSPSSLSRPPARHRVFTPSSQPPPCSLLSHPAGQDLVLTHGYDQLTQVALLQGLPQGSVLIQAPGIQVLPNSPTEQKGLLGDDSQLGSGEQEEDRTRGLGWRCGHFCSQHRFQL